MSHTGWTKIYTFKGKKRASLKSIKFSAFRVEHCKRSCSEKSYIKPGIFLPHQGNARKRIYPQKRRGIWFIPWLISFYYTTDITLFRKDIRRNIKPKKYRCSLTYNGLCPDKPIVSWKHSKSDEFHSHNLIAEPGLPSMCSEHVHSPMVGQKHLSAPAQHHERLSYQIKQPSKRSKLKSQLLLNQLSHHPN